MKTEEQQAMRREQKKPNLIAGFILLILLGAGAWFGYNWYFDSIKYVSTDDAAIDSDHVSVSAKIMGRIYQLTAEEGAKVETGQMLVQLDDTDLRAQEAQAVAALNSAYQNQSLAKVNLDKTVGDFNRTKGLLKSGFISKEQYDHSANTLDAAKVQYSIAQSQIETAKAQQGVIGTQLLNTKIVAPISGIIAKRAVMVGEVVQPGQAIYTINDLHHTWVSAKYEETKIRLIHPGQIADVTVDAYPNRLFKGKVVQIGADIVTPPLSIGDSTKTTQKIPVKIVFNQTSDAKLFVPGMSVEVKIER